MRRWKWVLRQPQWHFQPPQRALRQSRGRFRQAPERCQRGRRACQPLRLAGERHLCRRRACRPWICGTSQAWRGRKWPFSLNLSLSRWERGFALERRRAEVLPPTRGGRTHSLAQRERAGVREKVWTAEGLPKRKVRLLTSSPTGDRRRVLFLTSRVVSNQPSFPLLPTRCLLPRLKLARLRRQSSLGCRLPHEA